MTETYFGVFKYLTLRTELKEPNYTMEWVPDYKKLAMTVVVTGALWGAVSVGVRRSKGRSK